MVVTRYLGWGKCGDTDQRVKLPVTSSEDELFSMVTIANKSIFYI